MMNLKTSIKQTLPRASRVAIAATALLVGAILMPSTVNAQYRPDHIVDSAPQLPIPAPLIVDKTNAQIPLDLDFTRSDGTKLKLASLFDGQKPVILSLVFFSCPNLCGFAQDDLVNAVRSGPRNLEVAKDYNIVVVSIDPDDTPAEATLKRDKYVGIMGKPALTPKPDTGVIYLTGTEKNIHALADAVGFGYAQNFGNEAELAGKFAHSTGIFVLTPKGQLSQTILGLNWPTDKLHYALLQAADGKIGHGFLETIELPCGAIRLGAHGYEANPWFWAGTAGGGATLAFMAVFMGMLWRTEWKRRHNSPPVISPSTQENL
jgi:protein SCO1/2